MQLNYNFGNKYKQSCNTLYESILYNVNFCVWTYIFSKKFT